MDYLRHDIRNNLAKAQGYAQLFADKHGGEREIQRETVEEFITAYRRLERVVEEEGHFDQILVDEMRDTGSLTMKRSRNGLIRLY